jgi:hypothetical protein
MNIARAPRSGEMRDAVEPGARAALRLLRHYVCGGASRERDGGVEGDGARAHPPAERCQSVGGGDDGGGRTRASAPPRRRAPPARRGARAVVSIDRARCAGGASPSPVPPPCVSFGRRPASGAGHLRPSALRGSTGLRRRPDEPVGAAVGRGDTPGGGTGALMCIDRTVRFRSDPPIDVPSAGTRPFFPFPSDRGDAGPAGSREAVP